MQEVKIDFNPELELATVVVGSLGFLVRPKTILDGEAAVLERLNDARSHNTIAQEVKDKELIQGATMLINTPGIKEWAMEKLRYQV